MDVDTALWPDRCLTDGRLVVLRQPEPAGPEPTWLQRRGRTWRRLQRNEQWAVAMVSATVATSPLSTVSDDAQALGVLGVLAAGVVLLWRSREPGRPAVRAQSAEARLAASGTPEARVAAAATRAWGETIREHSWRSPVLAATRGSFDGRAEVDQVVELALRVHAARLALGRRPTGPAGQVHDEQVAALDRAAGRLGARADALIRYRDQAAALSVELRHLRDLERMERTALVVDGLTIETASGAGRPDPGVVRVTAEIEGVRSAMAELVADMSRTREPLLHDPTRWTAP
ncbi:hypothetical protein GB931_00595 [Modestobacter sp. I12A-02628]|uniref:Uncharacterized protein n=1 Tax=Goekera deserti TaxID=2497753 RepID=A0A7K3WG72_9ACTN|nr:hypothetical protein [Goekera deserti]NDI47243.1 hypothetical protein [Goekera deserti]NEL55356.1 hypothetical protein [Goekera deserti]